MVTSTNPTGGAAAWTVIRRGRLTAPVGRVLSQRQPLCRGRPQRQCGHRHESDWGSGGLEGDQRGQLPGWLQLPVKACPVPAPASASPVDGNGNVVTSSNPTGGAAAWKVTAVRRWLGGVSCPSSGLCVAVDGSGNVLTSSNPTGGAAAWTVTQVDTAL